MVMGGADPLAFLKTNKGRILAAHVQDVAQAGH